MIHSIIWATVTLIIIFLIWYERRKTRAPIIFEIERLANTAKKDIINIRGKELTEINNTIQELTDKVTKLELKKTFTE